MNIKDVVTYYDLSKLQKKHLQEMCLELDLDSKGLNDELAQRIWNYISANDNRDVLKNYAPSLYLSQTHTHNSAF